MSTFLYLYFRKAGWSGIQGTATVTGSQYYYFKAHLKLLNLAPGHLYHAISVKFKYTLNSKHLSGDRVTQSLVLYVCFVDRRLSFYTFSFGHCVVCSSLIYGFWLPIWYLQTFFNMFTQTAGIYYYWIDYANWKIWVYILKTGCRHNNIKMFDWLLFIMIEIHWYVNSYLKKERQRSYIWYLVTNNVCHMWIIVHKHSSLVHFCFHIFIYIFLFVFLISYSKYCRRYISKIWGQHNYHY